jgi:hypothetical protein
MVLQDNVFSCYGIIMESDTLCVPPVDARILALISLSGAINIALDGVISAGAR